MSKLYQIIDGWYRYFDGQTPKWALPRAKACASCQYSQESVYEQFIKEKDDFKMIEGLICTACGGCPISTKTRAKESVCEKGFWPEEKHEWKD